MVALVLFQPDIAQNTGTVLRMGACLGVAVHIVEPAGFDISDRNLRRAGLDYLTEATLVRHTSFSHFQEWRKAAGSRLVLMTTKAAKPYTEAVFRPDDLIMMGRESAGVPDEVHESADERLAIPMRPGLRSINVAMAAAMVLGEALRQTGAFPGPGRM